MLYFDHCIKIDVYANKNVTLHQLYKTMTTVTLMFFFLFYP